MPSTRDQSPASHLLPHICVRIASHISAYIFRNLRCQDLPTTEEPQYQMNKALCKPQILATMRWLGQSDFKRPRRKKMRKYANNPAVTELCSKTLERRTLVRMDIYSTRHLSDRSFIRLHMCSKIRIILGVLLELPKILNESAPPPAQTVLRVERIFFMMRDAFSLFSDVPNSGLTIRTIYHSNECLFEKCRFEQTSSNKCPSHWFFSNKYPKPTTWI